jgi:hypothetical protein
MEFQLRERITTTLKEIKDNAISVEANFLIKRLKIKEKEREKITKEEMISSKAKLDILASTMKEMMQKVIIGNELVVQGNPIPLVIDKERVIFPKHFAAHPWYHR